MKPRHPRDGGMALLVALAVVVLLAAVVAAAIGWTKNDRLNAGKAVHNLTVQDLSESTLQYGKSFFAQNYAAWNTYLAYFVTARTVTQVKTDHPELMASLPADAGFDCFTYAKDDVDNNLRILVGAVCVQQNGTLQSELIAPLEFNPATQACQAQFSGGTQGVNNCSTVAAYR